MQLMIVAGMISGIFVVSLKIMKNQNQIGKSSSEEFEIIYLFDDIRNSMADPAVCKSTLANVTPFESSDLEGIKSDSDTAEFSYEIFKNSGKKYGQKNIKIKSIDYLVGDQEGSVEDGEAFLRVAFEKSKSALGSKVVEKRMKIHLLISDSGKISSCFSLAGVNFKADEGGSNLSQWYSVSGTENIYTNAEKLQIGSSKSWKGPGVGLSGKLRILSERKPCNSERVGTLKFEREVGLHVCKRKGWHKVWSPREAVMTKDFTLTSSSRDKIETTRKPYHFCTIKDVQLYGARCIIKKLSGNLWKLSLLYDRGGESKCSFRCFSLR